jgi:predicted transcriptional regulator
MKDSSGKISFEKLTELVKALTAEEKQNLINILKEEKQFIVEEAAIAYVKKDQISFDEKWAQSISAAEFEKSARRNIEKLPWK